MVYISARRSAVLIHAFRSFRQSLQVKAGMNTLIRRRHFLPISYHLNFLIRHRQSNRNIVVKQTKNQLSIHFQGQYLMEVYLHVTIRLQNDVLLHRCNLLKQRLARPCSRSNVFSWLQFTNEHRPISAAVTIQTCISGNSVRISVELRLS
jgi:hypothetical protein